MNRKLLNEIIEALPNDVHLEKPNYNEKFYSQTDALEREMDGELFQDHGVICYMSRKLTKV